MPQRGLRRVWKAPGTAPSPTQAPACPGTLRRGHSRPGLMALGGMPQDSVGGCCRDRKYSCRRRRRTCFRCSSRAGGRLHGGYITGTAAPAKPRQRASVEKHLKHLLPRPSRRHQRPGQSPVLRRTQPALPPRNCQELTSRHMQNR